METWDGIKCVTQASVSNCIQMETTGIWDSETRAAATGLSHTFGSFEHIVVFMLAKQLLEPIHPITECLQGRLQELYFGFKKLTKLIRENIDAEHNQIYTKAKKLAAVMKQCHVP